MTTSLLDSDVPEVPSRGLLQDRLGYTFERSDLLDLALRHRSWCAENGGVESNERLEFLGDSVLGLVVTDHLYRRAPERSEGTLARNRSELVSAAALGDVARSIDLGGVVLLGKGELSTGGRDKTSILADAFEAVVGAVFIDGGMDAAEGVILRILGGRLDAILAHDMTTDFKSRLQEVTAADFGELPQYRLDEAGPEHDKRFSATVTVDGRTRGTGVGSTKKAAEQEAARVALEGLSGESIQGNGDASNPGSGRVGASLEEDHA